jgi:hypothetical protein
MVGFGSLMIAGHQGLQSLGRVLTIGVSCCLVNSLVILPALLSWISRHRGEQPSGDLPWDDSSSAIAEDDPTLVEEVPGRRTAA